MVTPLPSTGSSEPIFSRDCADTLVNKLRHVYETVLSHEIDAHQGTVAFQTPERSYVLPLEQLGFVRQGDHYVYCPRP